MLGMLQHTVPAIWGDDGEFYRSGICNGIVVRKRHCAGMKSRNLVAVTVGCDESLCRVGVRHSLHTAARNAQSEQSFKVRRTVLPDGCHDQGIAVEEFEIVGDVSGAAAEFTSNGRHQEGAFDFMQLVSKQRLGKSSAEGHDGVKGKGAADQRSHDNDVM